ncbi:MAG: hypothetical protein V4627_01945 [Pseudomonadota bacterium]
MRVDISGVKPNSTFESLLRTVGFVVIQWAHCEQSLELLVNTLFREFGGNKLPGRKRMPKPISEKISFVKECTAQIPSLASFKAEIDALASDFDAVLQTRHNLIHGALSDTPVFNGVFTFIRLETHPDIHEVKESQYDLKEFPTLEAALTRLGAKAPKLARKVFAARPNHP